MIVSLPHFKHFRLLLLKGKNYENEQKVWLTWTRINTADQNARPLVNCSDKPFGEGNQLGKEREKETRAYWNHKDQHNYNEYKSQYVTNKVK